MMQPTLSDRRQRGFSLLEVLVAFTIMGLSLAVLYQLAGGSVRNVAYLERQAHAVMIAESLLALHPRVPPDGVAEQGGTADTFRWRISSRPLGTEWLSPESAATAWPLYELRAVVAWRDLGREREIELFTVVPEQAAVPPAPAVAVPEEGQ